MPQSNKSLITDQVRDDQLIQQVSILSKATNNVKVMD